jgi:Coenzyme PQQ synthesis protein D (PqqD)
VTLIHARHVAWRDICEEFVVVDLAEKKILGFNLSAGLVWCMLDQPREIRTLTATMEAAMQRQVTEFINTLTDRGLLVETDDPALRCQWPLLVDPPIISWCETIQQAGQASTCAFLPAQNPLCNQVPFS